ncbi:hypothetical protein A2415_04650 [candidate division WWE3 bacterium RIFOXYC1_FULL_39_7]|uniref:Transglutaminase-like domain-containing protein n=2 Tax=Katanobacteria TaxID=422282 RepID=A0A1F4X780_UNCKA|nr:MAG: hypothetical protein A2415_04650 [candidate division WWE3 bacterium RIFOXYC1_FULL_39_7]OGC77508.1 MAG: hypothetical protein A2619_01375 [candidate division WWE3 bacterium RIFOXYD1_FULL_39_9]
MRLIKYFFTFAFLVVTAPLVTPKVHAEGDFLTEYGISYDIGLTGETTVTQDVTITNLRNDVIVQTYTLKVKQLDIYDIKIHEKNRDIEVDNEKTLDETTIKVTLNSFNIGEGRQNKFSIIYKSKDIANKIGEVWNINIPRTQAVEATTGYNINFSVPNAFGDKIFISPVPILEESKNNLHRYYFTKESLADKNITAAFGNYQYINFRLKYQLHNPNLLSSIYEIPLPPDIKSIQQVKYGSFNVMPDSVRTDPDGNVIAQYKLKPKQNLEVELIGNAKISGRQINLESGGALSEIPGSVISLYTRPQPFWETRAANIKEISEKLYNKDQNVIQNANNIYNYIVENFSYDFATLNEQFVDRKGASKSLENTAGWACMEFTDTFIALARSMGIPARELNGYALSGTDNTRPLSINLRGGDFLHAWPEFYDPNYGWIQIDPTWGDTSNTDYFSKLDTNHFVLVIKGIDSDSPLPPGTYRFDENSEDKLVEVEFTDNPQNVEFKPEVEINQKMNLNILQMLFGRNKYELVNTGKVFLYTEDGEAIPPLSKRIFYREKDLEDLKLKIFNGQEILFKIM